MKFITRDLYQAMQAFPLPAEIDALWHRQCDAYRNQLSTIRPQFPLGMQALSEQTFHDGVVRSIAHADPSVLELVVDASRNPWGPRGIFRIRFTGVREVDGIDHIVGDDWLYEEVHLHEVGRFDYRVLFWKSDFRVVADEVDVDEITIACLTDGKLDGC